MIENITTATPVEIDTRLAELHAEIYLANAVVRSLTNRLLDRAGLRIRHSATWQTRRTTYTVKGTFDDAVEILTAHAAASEAWRAAGYPREGRPADLVAGYSGAMSADEIESIVAKRAAAIENRFALWTEANSLDGEFRARGGWPRYFLVISSIGHIHSSTACSTCRRTTGFGWMPEHSGLTEAQAIAKLDKRADALCSVCFPDAPVVSKRTKITKAQAEKLAAATYVRPDDEGADTE
jgi:hypothetical protein